jgi:restriction system protein
VADPFNESFNIFCHIILVNVMARRRTSPFEDLVDTVSKMPWWIGLVMALVSYLILHQMSIRPPVTVTGPAQMGAAATGGLIRVLAMFGQFVLPFAFVLGSLISAFKTLSDKKPLAPAPKRTGGPIVPGERKSLDHGSRSGQPAITALPVPVAPRQADDGWTPEILAALEWKRFETVCAEYLRLIGFDPKETRIGADGGVDIWIYKQGMERPFGIVQCKAWNTYKVGIKPVRELYGVMSAEKVANGLFITSGTFTSEAMTFAEGKLITLFSGQEFLAKIKSLAEKDQATLLNIATAGDYRTPTCPQCGIKMTLRNGVDGNRAFWGCVKFPKCRATLVYKKAEIEEPDPVPDWAY